MKLTISEGKLAFILGRTLAMECLFCPVMLSGIAWMSLERLNFRALILLVVRVICVRTMTIYMGKCLGSALTLVKVHF